MWRYLIKRIGVVIPTLLIISFVAFFLSKLSPGDPVDRLLSRSGGEGTSYDRTRYEKEYKDIAHQLGLDLPIFYFSLNAAAYPDTLHRIVLASEKETISKLIAQHGNWPEIDRYYKIIKSTQVHVQSTKDSLAENALVQLRKKINQLLIMYRAHEVRDLLEQIEKESKGAPSLNAKVETQIAELKQAYHQVEAKATRSRLYIPSLRWFGFNNQYHHWLTHFVSGDMGRSLDNGKPVWERIKSAAWWTIIINVLAMFLAYAISIPLGVYAAVKRGKLFDKVSSVVLFALYSLPSFWLATILVVFFTTSSYGEWMNIFPSIGLGQTLSSDPFWVRFWDKGAHLILPVICVTYVSLAFIARQMRGSILRVINQDFIRTAQAKGAPKRQVIWKHAFRNALFPLITMFALLFPAAIAGSLVIEVIFNIPGMGRLVYFSILGEDWPVVFAVLMITAILTILGNLVADICYVWADPRVKLDKA